MVRHPHVLGAIHHVWESNVGALIRAPLDLNSLNNGIPIKTSVGNQRFLNRVPTLAPEVVIDHGGDAAPE